VKPGFLYIVTNPAHPGFVKVGVTQNISERLHTYQTGDPKRQYKVEFYIFHPDAYKAEKVVQEGMKYFAKSRKNEWFEIQVHMAISRLEEVVENIHLVQGENTL
jgi:predicted GIY-YIG superfamily endonuclease